MADLPCFPRTKSTHRSRKTKIHRSYNSYSSRLPSQELSSPPLLVPAVPLRHAHSADCSKLKAVSLPTITPPQRCYPRDSLIDLNCGFYSGCSPHRWFLQFFSEFSRFWLRKLHSRLLPAPLEKKNQSLVLHEWRVKSSSCILYMLWLVINPPMPSLD